MSKESLNRLRRKIEDLDVALLKLLNERADVSVQIGKLKVQNGLSIYDPSREEAIYEYLAKHNPGPIKTSEMNRIFSDIMSVSRNLQSAMIGDAGEPPVELAVHSNPDALSATISIYGILGNPVAHSMSPLMHNAAFKLLGINAIYLPFEVEDLQGAVAGMKALGIRGASVTHPFKTQVIELIDEVDDTAEKIGAVNTLVFEKGTIRGTNTDWIGAVRCLETLLPIKGHKFVVLGAGGAARAVVFGITSKGGKAFVVSRSEEQGGALAKEFDSVFVPLSEIESVRGDCLVNTTPVGMYPKEDELPVPKYVINTFNAVADVIYNPLQTMLIREAEAAGCMVASGFEMFVYQGTEQFTIWTGREAPFKEMREVVYERLAAI